MRDHVEGDVEAAGPAATASACSSTHRAVERVDLGGLGRPPSARISSATTSSVASVRPARKTRAPSRAKAARHRAADRARRLRRSPRSCLSSNISSSRSRFVFGLVSPPRLIGAAKEASASPRRIPAVKMIVLGIDPGTANTGYGVVARARRAHGGARRRRDRDLAGVDRRRAARDIHARVAELLDEHAPEAVAVEELYFGANARSAFAVGQARGVVLLAAGQRGDPVLVLHAAADQGRGLRLRPRRQGPGPADGPDAARARRSCRGPTTPPTRSPSRSATPTRGAARAHVAPRRAPRREGGRA